MTSTMTEKQAAAQWRPALKTELMFASIFVAKFWKGLAPASAIFSHRYNFGTTPVARAHLEALRLVCDMGLLSEELTIEALHGKGVANVEVPKIMRRRRRRGFSLRDYKKWKAAL